MLKFFFDENGFCNIDESIAKRDTFKKILEDGKITEDEVKKQSELVILLLNELDEKLDEKEKKMVLDVICEMSILYTLSQKNIIDNYERTF